MAIDNHIQQLEEKHRALDLQLDEMMASPSVADSDIAKMKRQKLHLKDKISKLRSEQTEH